MRLASRIPVFALLICATVSAHAAPGDPDPRRAPLTPSALSGSATTAPEPDDSLRVARLGVTVGTPDGRYAHSAIVDAIGSRMVMYGGFEYPASNDLWQFALEGTAAWSPLPVGAIASPVRGGHVAVLDTVRRRMLVFGGADAIGRRNETWAYSLASSGVWSQIAETGLKPSPRSLHTAIYDPVRDRLIVFGGYQDSGYLNDVWALTLSGTPAWTPLIVGGTPPTPRRECSAVYDPVRDRMIIFGGTNGIPNREVWALNLGGTPTWSLLTSAGTGLLPRSGHSAIYDPQRDRMWVFAGRDGNGNILNDLWTLSLAGTPAWTQQYPSGTIPGVRVYHSAVLDAANDRMVVFSGYSGNLPNDTWFLALAGNPTWYPLGSEPPVPATSPEPRFDPASIVVPASIELGQSFTLSVSVRNHGVASDDGIISMSFPGLTDPADGQWVESSASGDTPGYSELPAGSPMVRSDCQPMTAGALAVEYRDDAWEAFGAEQNVLAVTVRPRATGTFYIDVRSTMRKPGTTCEYVNAYPSGVGEQGIDQQGWAVRRFAVNVVDTPAPSFPGGVVQSAYTIELGQTFTISTTMANAGAASDDGRIAIGFPDLTDPADAQWVSSTAGGDDPGYLEHPAGSALTDAVCQPITASYLLVEYADDDWAGLDTESNALSVTVRPRAGGIFAFDVRGTMHRTGIPCGFVNAVPAGGGGALDQQNRPVRRFSVTVLDMPSPIFAGSVTLSDAVIELGQTFTISATVGNPGASSDDGRIAFSFPDMTAASDAQWVSSPSAGDTPGYLEHPAGSALTDAGCQPLSATYLVTEFADSGWQGLGQETNALWVTVQPKAAGTFHVYVRATLHQTGSACEYVNVVPANGEGGFTDQTGRAVNRFTVTVTNLPAPAFTGPITVSPSTLELGQTFTISAAVNNFGASSDDGRIAFSFPAMTNPADAQWVTSSSGGDTPGYLEHPAGSALTDASCQPLTASYLMVEYADGNWLSLGAESNLLTVTVRPPVSGTFTFYVRSTLHRRGTVCEYVNAMPGGVGTATDQQGWAVRAFSVTVIGGPAPDYAFFDPGTTTIQLGQAFTLAASVRNTGAASDDGRIAISFPGMTAPGDAQWVSSPSAGDAPGYVERPAGSALTDASCRPIIASCLQVEYADASWLGLGVETNAFSVSVTPQTAGTFYVFVRTTMRVSGTACEFVHGLPPAGESGFTDQQGWPVKRYAVAVVDTPDPIFTTDVILSASTIGLGQSFTITTTVRNDGASTPDGRIAISFPALTDAADAQWVSSASAGDIPGYLERPAGSSLTDASCQPLTATCLLAEYVDGDWSRFGAETNTFSVSVRPQAMGTFYFYVRSTMRKAAPDPCALVTDLPAGGESDFADQQGFPVKRFAVTVGPTPPPPAPAFTRLQILSPAGGSTTITLGQSISLAADVRNDGGWTDDGRIVFSFHSACLVSMPGPDYPAGDTLLDASCQPLITTRAVSEFVDDPWDAGELQTIQVVLTPQVEGTFLFDVRSTMHVPGASCAYVNAVPAGGSAAVDEQGWAVRRFSFTVRPVAPSPAFTTPVTGIPASITFGESFTLTATLGNEGTTSPDGRLVVGFPQLVETGDAIWVSNSTSGDTPGYREMPAGSALTGTSCQTITAPYLVVEYADQIWGGYDISGAENREQNTVVLTVTPQTVGDFFVQIRGTMRRNTGDCVWSNGLPVEGEGGFTDAQGWPVKRFRVQVNPGIAAEPVPTFTVPVEISATVITVGQSFTVRTRVRNDGSDSDEGIISVSFPSLTSGSDGQWVTPLVAGADVPGYQELPAGSVIPDVGCYYDPASYLAVEYVDGDWRGIQNGHELNELQLTIRPPVTGTFYVYVRAAMREAGTFCGYRTGLPPNGEAGYVDQQGFPVKRFAVTVAPVPPGTYGPAPVFLGTPSGFPTYITLGQSLTISMSVRNDGLASDGGNITVSFPAFTGSGDDQWVTGTASGDTPGYREHPAGSPLPGADCQTVTASHLAVEYADAGWLGGEINSLLLTVVPQAVGVFSIDIRSTMHTLGAPPCDEASAIPAGGAGTFTDQQGREVRRFQVNVFTIPEPGTPTMSWTPITPPAGGPEPRHGASFAYDEPRDELFLYGGAGAHYFSDIWSLPLEPGSSWHETVPGGSPPLRRIMHSMIHNPVEGHFVFFGGYYNNLMDDLALLALRPVPWWFSIAKDGPSPSPRIGHTATYDPIRHRMLLIGGYDNALHNDVWAYPLPGNGTWTRLEPLGTPMPARAQHATVYDPVRDRMIVFGGDGGTFLSDAWELKLGGTPEWGRITLTDIPPSGRREHTMVYDNDRDRMLVFGGFDGARRNDLWALTLGDPPRWQELLSTTSAPAARSMHGAIYDRLRHRMVMFGGQLGTNSYSNELWALTDNTLTPALASLVSTECLPDRVRLTWAVEAPSPIRAEVHRSAGEAEGWTVIGRPEPSGDRLVFEDRDVTPGARLGYRLVELEESGETVLNEAWVTVPLRLGLALAGASPNPAEGELRVAFSLPAGGAATLELFDLRGRLLGRREVGVLGAGEHRIRFDEAGRIRAGVYLLRLVRGDRVLTAKACVIR